MRESNHENKVALILGGSSGLGLATAKKLASRGYGIVIVHRDRRADSEKIKIDFQEITSNTFLFKTFNVDAVNAVKRELVIKELTAVLGPELKIDVLVHSLAKGNLRPMYATDGNVLHEQDFQLTIQAMALSLYDWTKTLFEAGLFAADTRIVSFTSEGNTKAWVNYGAVSAAKATLEAITRNIALEFAPLGIKANCIQAGVTDTVSFRRIPGHKKLRQNALERNPHKRLTTPEDVANAVYLLTTDEAKWITGTVVKVDGGESLR